MRFISKFGRRKPVVYTDSESTLRKCLTLLDLILIGIGGMVGSGIYILAGVAAKEMAGPSVILSFIVAGLVIALTALCYIEFASQIHVTGSSYQYMYYTLGEFSAFTMGVAGLISAVTGAATNARVWSAYLDSLCHNCIANYTETHILALPHHEFLSSYPDLVAVVILVMVTVVVSVGAKCSARFNGFFAACNVGVLVLFSTVAFVYADPANWRGQFLAFGWQGILQASGACFWAFSGFEMIALSVEEAKLPSRDVPLATFISLSLVAVLYIATSAALTLVTNYKLIDGEAPLPFALDSHGLTWAHYIVVIGPLCGLTTSLLNCVFGFVRTCYAMAQDGLLGHWWGYVPECSQVPVIPAIVCMIVSIVLAVFVDIREIITFGINLTILNYMLVNVSIIIMRYRPSTSQPDGYVRLENLPEGGNHDDTLMVDFGSRKLILEALLPSDADDEDLKTHGDALGVEVAERDARIDWVEQRHGNQHGGDAWSHDSATKPSDSASIDTQHKSSSSRGGCGSSMVPSQHVHTLAVLGGVAIVVVCIALAAALLHGAEALTAGNAPLVTATGLLCCTLVLLILFFTVFLQQNRDSQPFRLPCVPLLPTLSIFSLAVLLVANSSFVAWIGTAVTLSAATVVYLVYGIHHSKLEQQLTRKLQPRSR